MNFIKCPKCQAEIEDDSLYCDQCGMELFVCSSCGTLGKGKRCTRCGQPLVAKKDAKKSPTSANAPMSTTPPSSPTSTTDIQKLFNNTASPTPAVSPSQPVSPTSGTSSTVRPDVAPQPAAPDPTPPGHLVCQNPPLRLLVTDVLIGRREGGYASVFAAHGMVSGRHASLSSTPNGDWQVTDLGSTNGTKLNGMPLPPNVPTVIHVGDTLSIANLDFQVTP